MSRNMNRDDDLIDALRRALNALPAQGVDPTEEPPASVLAGAAWVHDWRNMDGALAELTYDSSHQPELAGVRSATGALRELTFVSGNHTIEVEIEPGPRTATVSGTVDPPGAGSMQLLVGGEVFASDLDETGAFLIEGVAHGTVLAYVDIDKGRIRLGSFEI